MSRRGRMLRNSLIAGGTLIVTVAIALLVAVHTEWFRNYVRQAIVSATEESTGGRVEVGSFDFDRSRFRATIKNFVIHGDEPAGSAPFVRVAEVVADIRLFTAGKLLDLAYLRLDRPETNIVILADGRTNIPSPKNKTPSKQPVLKTVVDLAVGHFELNNGMLALESRKQPLNISGNNLRAQLSWNVSKQTYGGGISLDPLYTVAGRNAPVRLRINVPVTIGSDRIDIHNASIATPASALAFDGSLENVRAPRITARIEGSLALADLKNAGDLPVAVNARGVPARIDLAANVTASPDSILITAARVTMGRSTFEASGAFEDPRGQKMLAFHSILDADELSMLVNAGVKSLGTIAVDGNASLDGGRHDLKLTGLHVAALGGELTGSAALQNLRRYQVNGELRGFDIRSLLRAAGGKAPYDGVISGPITVIGDTDVENNLFAQARLSITPGKRGIPLSGRLNAEYNALANNVAVGDSYLVLPHSRLDVHGSLDKSLSVSLKTRDLNDLLAAAGVRGQAVALNRGEATFAGTIMGALRAPRIAGHLAASRLIVEGREFSSLGAEISASGSGVAIRNGTLTRSAMQARFSGSVGLLGWKTLPREPVTADLSISNGDLADAVALAGLRSTDYSGALSVAAHVSGTTGNPSGTAGIQASHGTIDGQPFDQAHIDVALTDQLVTIPAAYIQAGAGRVDLRGDFRHPRESFTTGQVRASLTSNQVDLSKTAAGQPRQNASGTAQVNVEAAGDLNAAGFVLTSVNGDLSAHALTIAGRTWGDLQANARTSAQTAIYSLTSNFAGSSIRLSGRTQLARDYPTTADANIARLPIERALAVMQQTGIPARGDLSGSVHLTGTVSDPHGDADLALTRAVFYDEPIDQLRLRAAYLARSIDISQLQIAAGPSRVELSAHYDHPPGNLRAGNVSFNVESSRIDLARIQNVRVRRPGLGGTLRITGHGAGEIAEGSSSAAEPQIAVHDLNLNVAATGIAAQGKNFGDLTLTANATAKNKIDFALDSNLADASIHGRGTAEMIAGYPVDAQLSFNNLLYTRIAGLLGTNGERPMQGEAALDGRFSLAGPVLDYDRLHAGLQLTRLSITSNPKPGHGKPIAISNQGPLSATLDHGVVHIDNAHLSGGPVDIQAGGTVSLPARSLALTLKGAAGLEILPSFDPDLYSSGNIDLAATIRGSFAQPLVNGQLTLRDAAFNYAGLPNGISNATGVVAFNGNSASIRNFSAESGGGKITVTGFAAYTDAPRFDLHLKASRVRIRPQQGVSVTAGADLELTGTSRRSVMSGSAVIEQVTYNPRTDVASILSRASPAVQSAAPSAPLLENMRLDVRVRTSSGLSVQAAMAESLSASADLRVGGTAAQPGVLGRITINQGQLAFFGSSYTVDTGTIGFYNPLRVDPILDISLQTQAQGVDVTLRVTGPVDNMKLGYTSNPPLQFQEIVGLLATGKTPTSDPTLLANQPQAPQSSFQQMGESAVLSQAVANPVAGRLQRVFGVSQLKLDPAFQGGSAAPTARMTLQQRVTSNLTFTYTAALDDPNGEIIKIEWAFDPRWSALATRDQNGIFSINFLYKRQFR